MKISCVMKLVVSMLAFCGCADSRERLDINIEKGDSLTVELDSMQSALEIIGSARESARLRKFTFVKYVNSIQCSECVVKNLWTLGGMQIFVSGMVGEYIAKIYTEVKRRPRYFIWEELK